MWRVEFESARFLPYLPEDCQGNPGAYGFELAQWLSAELMKRGIATSYPLGEDWGWLIEFLEGELELTIGCGSQAEEGDGYGGKAIPWSIFIREPGGLFKKKSRPEAQAAIARLSEQIVACLAGAGIEAQQVEA